MRTRLTTVLEEITSSVLEWNFGILGEMTGGNQDIWKSPSQVLLISEQYFLYAKSYYGTILLQSI